ncbi:MAG: molybdenum cofactor guanylyltransferase [Methylococcales bacterium]|nr:molybdenum cofactor guanylyltransferase [Methylococcales bacterium]
MSEQKKVTGVVLAGGLARRMNKQDKGLMLYHNRPMVSYAVEAISEVTDTVFINANRNKDQYMQFGCEVISDQTDSFDGPLAGIFSAMSHAKTDKLLIMPCDSPLIKATHLQKLLQALTDDVDIAVAFDGERLHPVFLALKTSLKNSLKAYLQAGDRKIDLWLQQHSLVKVDFSNNTEVFLNINTLSELDALEKSKDE